MATRPAGVKVFSPRTAAAVRKMLQMAAGPGGTGQKAQTVGYSVGGKSGTAHKQVGKGYATNKYRVLVHRHGADRQAAHHRGGDDRRAQQRQYYGGAVAAPVFSEVVQQTLRMMGVQPDMAVKPQIVVQAVEESF
jgi:cell division protein FtsI (penicillin-binding protein 3)